MTCFLIPAFYSCSLNKSFIPLLLCWKEKRLTFQPRWRPLGGWRFLMLVGAWPGLSSPAGLALWPQDIPKDLWVWGSLCSSDPRPQGHLPKLEVSASKPGVPSSFPLEKNLILSFLTVNSAQMFDTDIWIGQSIKKIK